MTIRAMLGFAHLPKRDTYGTSATGCGLALSGYGITFATDHAANPCWVDDNNAIYIANLADYRICRVTIPFTGLTDFTSPKTILGFRYTLPVGMRGDSTMVIGGVTIGFQELGLPASGPATNYVELVCDRVTKEISYFVNGEFKLKKVSTVVPIAVGQTMAFTTSSYGNAAMTLKDFYVIDDTQDDTPCSRLGPVSVKPLVSLTASGEGWTTLNAVPLLDVLNTPFTDAASILAPVASSPENLAPIEVGISEPTTGLAPIKGIMFALSSRRVPASAVGLELGIKTGQSLKYGNATTFASDAVTHTHSGVFQKAPDGTEWTPDKVKATILVVKPKPV